MNLKKVVARVHDRRRPATVREYLPSADHAENRAIERRETQGASAITTLPGTRELLQFPVKHCAIATSARDRWPQCLSAAGLPVPERLATWIRNRGATLNKPTRFQTRDGKF